MTTTALQTRTPKSPLAEQNQRLAGLRTRHPPLVAEGHRSFDVGLWLSTETGSGARFDLVGEGAGAAFRLTLTGGTASRWAALGFRLPVDALRQGRRLGVLMAGTAKPSLVYRTTLRYVFEAGFEDVDTGYAVLDDVPGERLAHMPLDAARLDRCERAEVHIFFSGDDFAARITQFETFLMV